MVLTEIVSLYVWGLYRSQDFRNRLTDPGDMDVDQDRILKVKTL